MTPYASTAALAGRDELFARLETYAEAGLTHVELGAGITVTDDPSKLGDRLARLDLRFLVHNYFPPPSEPFVLNLASPDDDVRTRSMRMVEAALELSAQLGAPFYSVHGGWVTDPIGFGAASFVLPEPESPAHVSAAEDRFVGTLEHLLGRADALGVDLLVENNVCTPELRGKILLEDAAGFHSLFRRLRSERLGVLLDFGHLRVSAATLGFEPSAFVEEIAPYIRAFHVHDNDGAADLHEPAADGSWVADTLRRPEFVRATAIDEARFETVDELARHVRFLAALVARDPQAA